MFWDLPSEVRCVAVRSLFLPAGYQAGWLQLCARGSGLGKGGEHLGSEITHPAPLLPPNLEGQVRTHMGPYESGRTL